MSVHLHPVMRPRPAPARFVSVSLYDIAARLGRAQQSDRVIVAVVRVLIEREGFPEPLGRRLWKGEWVRGAQAVCRMSRWDADRVDAWFHDDLPPAEQAAVDQAEHRAAADLLDANALRLIAGGRA